MEIKIEKEVNLTKLHKEMLEAGVIESNAYFGNEFFIAQEDADITIINTILENHTIEPLPQEPTQEERLASMENMITMLMGV